MEALLENIYEEIVVFFPRLGIGLIILAISWLLATVLGRLILRLGRRLDVQRRQVITLAASTAKSLIVLIGAVTALGTMGLNISALVASLGLTGFALGFALKDALSNLLAGALILIYQPFRHGDRIAVAGSEGVVTEINLRYTVLEHETERFLIPNASLFSNSIKIMGGPGGPAGGGPSL